MAMNAVRAALVVVLASFVALPGVANAAEQAAAADDGGFLDDLGDEISSAAQTVLAWLVVIGGLLLVVLLVRMAGRGFRRWTPPRRGICVALEDLSGGASGGSGALGQEVEAAIRSLAQSAAEQPPAEIDAARDLDGSLSLNVRVAGDALATLGPYVNDATPVKVGPIAFTPRQLLTFISSTFARRYQFELRGFMAASGSTTRLVLDLQCRTAREPVRWSCSDDGEAARGTVVTDAARRVLFETSEKPVSVRWRSVEAHQKARSITATLDDAPDRFAALQDARRLLERALAIDAGNQEARFELGTVLRKLGQNREASLQYRLINVFPGPGQASDPTLRRAIDYCRAVALSKVDAWEEHREAKKLLEAVDAEVEHDSDLKERTREAHRLVIRSALAATLVFEAERLRSEADSDRLEEASAAVLQRVMELRDWVDQADQRTPDVDVNAFVQACAVAENAAGRVAYLAGRPREEVVACLERAVALAPDLGDAHVNLATALLRGTSGPPDRDERVRRHLDRALEISPHDAKARYLRAKLYGKLGLLDQQREDLQVAVDAGDHLAVFTLAELEWRDGHKLPAVELARRSLTLRPSGRWYRARVLVAWIADPEVLADARAETLEAGLGAARQIEKRAREQKRETTSGFGAEVARIEQRRDELRAASTDEDDGRASED